MNYKFHMFLYWRRLTNLDNRCDLIQTRRLNQFTSPKNLLGNSLLLMKNVVVFQAERLVTLMEPVILQVAHF